MSTPTSGTASLLAMGFPPICLISLNLDVTRLNMREEIYQPMSTTACPEWGRSEERGHTQDGMPGLMTTRLYITSI
uniref:Uncharacterized protein n=1 Tax=Scleropages formosus TaxID=113540 RepID=A0A8C9TAQ9_SCLFO